MKKLTAADPETRSPDPVIENIDQLAALFPDAFIEGAIDFDVLRQLLGKAVDDRDEKFGLNWHGKRAARQAALTPSTGTLRPVSEESIDWESTRNLMIEGDNLEVLKLLQKSYHGKVKLIYIDPPYNTGNDFIYPDDYSESLQTYLEYTGQVDDEGKRFSTNTDTDGRFHSKWLSMMYPRLFLARSLLHQEGLIFVSIDDHEVHNLRALLNEIFGEENFLASIIWENIHTRKNTAQYFSDNHNYILAFARNKSRCKVHLLPRTSELDAGYDNRDDDSRGPWGDGPVHARNYYSKGTYPIVAPGGRVFDGPPTGRYWSVSKEEFDALDTDGRIWWGRDGNNAPRIKRFLSEVVTIQQVA